MNFSDKLIRLMSRENKGQDEVGRAVGVSQQSVSNWIKGSSPRKTVVIKLAQFFNVQPNVLMDDTVDLDDEVVPKKAKPYPEKFYQALEMIEKTCDDALRYGTKSPEQIIDSIEKSLRKLAGG